MFLRALTPLTRSRFRSEGVRGLRRSRAQIMCVLASSLTACSSESLEMTTTDPGQRWKVEEASGTCNAQKKGGEANVACFSSDRRFIICKLLWNSKRTCHHVL